MKRREVLAGVGVSLTVFPGCTGDSEDTTTTEPAPTTTAAETGTPTATETATPTDAFDPTEYLEDWHPEWARAEGTPAETTGDVPDQLSIDRACENAATEELSSTVDSRLDAETSLSYGGRVDSAVSGESQLALGVTRVLERSGNGDVISEPNVSFERLRSVTPKTVTATVTDGDNSNTCNFEIYIHDVVLQLE